MVKQKSGAGPRRKKAKKTEGSEGRGGLRMGRPNLSEGPRGGRSPLVAIRFPPAELAEIDALAAQAGIKRSEMVRRLVQAGKSKK